MKIIGITGGVGAGKSAVLNFIKDNYNAKVLQADEIAHELMEPGKPCNEQIAKAFEVNVRDESGNIKKEVLADLIFNNDMNRRLVNSIVHPAVRDYVIREIARERRSGEVDFFIYEAALLLEDKRRDFLDEIWYIHSSEDVRRGRLKETRGYSDEKIDSIFASQMSEDEFRGAATAVIENDGSLEETHEQIRKLLENDGGVETMAPENEGRQYVFGLDIGTRNVVGIVGYKEEEEDFHVVAMCNREHETRAMLDGQIHDINKVGKTVALVKQDLEEKIGQPLTDVCIAAAGRVLKTITTDVEYEFPEETIVTPEHIHSLDLFGIEKAQNLLLENNDTKFRFYCVGYTVIKYYLNDDIISNLEGHKANKIREDLIVTFLPEDVVDGLYAAVGRAGLRVLNLTLEPIAAINVAIPENFRMLNLALVDVGAGTSDICVTRDGSIIAYGMIPYAGDEITELLVQHYLVDFNTAEHIKIGAGEMGPIEYKDIMCISHQINPQEVWDLTADTVGKIAEDVAERIMELNGASPVSAVFIVGGGGKIHGFSERVAAELDLPNERVALRGEEVLGQVVFEEEGIKKDPLIVTPVGICLNYFEQKNSFIFVHFNGERIKLYNNARLTIVDAAVEAGFPNEGLFPKRGKELSFYVGDKQRIIRGEMGEPAVIKVNDREVSLNTPINNNSFIELTPSTEGAAAHCTIAELPEYESTINFIVNGQNVACPRYAEVDGVLQSPTYEIQDGDCIEMRNYYTVEQLVAFMDVAIRFDSVIYVNNQSVDPDEKVYENFTVDFMIVEPDFVEEERQAAAEAEAKEQGNATEEAAAEQPAGEAPEAAPEQPTGEAPEAALEQPAEEASDAASEQTAGEAPEVAPESKPEPSFAGDAQPGDIFGGHNTEPPKEEPGFNKFLGLHVVINGCHYTMKGKDTFTFVDIFDYISFNLRESNGRNVITMINGNNCGYNDVLHDGDDIVVKWSES